MLQQVINCFQPKIRITTTAGGIHPNQAIRCHYHQLNAGLRLTALQGLQTQCLHLPCALSTRIGVGDIFYRVSHKFVLTLYLRLKQNTLRFDIIMTTQYVPHFMGYHMNTRCGMPPAEFCNVAGLK